MRTMLTVMGLSLSHQRHVPTLWGGTVLTLFVIAIVGIRILFRTMRHAAVAASASSASHSLSAHSTAGVLIFHAASILTSHVASIFTFHTARMLTSHTAGIPIFHTARVLISPATRTLTPPTTTTATARVSECTASTWEHFVKLLFLLLIGCLGVRVVCL
ncbi:hypothetical protein BDV95DRAFT_558393 [Massariosphaeria phaeospora]|uniref:Uncharacterized protein n=1 Tax=Massariosphaeria phaeospora TaxID=100035 RepID=A0A7C8II85_9PLEO|nr:hypothetical protein BDV95DRAFT_558393 [Massariosphaeria phaeospora]